MTRFAVLLIIPLLFQTGCKKGPPRDGNVKDAGGELAAQMKSLEENWTPDSRVTEKSRGPLIVFQAHDHEIAVDWAFEVNKANIDKSIRHFPIDIVLLNNSFDTLEFEEAGVPLFTFTIRSGIDHIIKEYVSIQTTDLMLPGERIDCMINWDGRDLDGQYALPGRYEFITEVACLKGHSKLKIARDFQVTEAGPNVEVILNEQQLMLRQMEEFDRINQSLFGP
ncbi:MAG: hypothetical protein K9N55_07385 [Phycisphaerae bacterium]|nr:hypothetical protein [Phycisphaerae bacterium]